MSAGGGVPQWRCRGCGSSSRSLLDQVCTRCGLADAPALYFKTCGAVVTYSGGEEEWWCSLGEHQVVESNQIQGPTGNVWICTPCLEAVRRREHTFRIGREEVRRG